MKGAVAAWLQALHSYDLLEVLAFKVSTGRDADLDCVGTESKA